MDRYFYKIYMTNFYYYLPEEFTDLDRAKAVGESKKLEFRIDKFHVKEEFVETIGFSTTFSGWHDMNEGIGE